MARILNHCSVSADQIKQMVTIMHDSEQQQVGQEILTRLVNDGIKKYMEKWFNEKKQRQVIELVFNTIIIKNFEKEYQNTVTYNKIGNDCKSQYYQTMVFNMDDLMCFIFQFVCDLINCSLVNSYWLCHSWNPNSIYHFCLTKLIKNTIEMIHSTNISNDNRQNRMDRILSSKWQRVVNVKSVEMSLFGNRLEKSEYLFEKISMLRNIVNINLRIADKYISFLKELLCYNKKNIQQYSVSISCLGQKNKLQPLELINANVIEIETMYYYIKWSYKCQILRLQYFYDIDENWIKYVVDNCDCSGVQTFVIKNVSFNHLLNDSDRKSTQLLINKFCQKFENLQRLTINSTDDEDEENTCLILLLRCLSGIINKNNTIVKLKLACSVNDYDELAKMTQDTQIKICGLDISIDDESPIDYLKPIVLNNPKLEYIAFDTWFLDEDFVEKSILDLLFTIKKERGNGKASLLKMIKIDDNVSQTNINIINQLLLFELIEKDNCNCNYDYNHKLYRKLSFNLRTNLCGFCQESFKTICQIIASLLMSQQIPFELDIRFDKQFKSDFTKVYYPIFEQYLSQDLMQNWQPPIVNKYCKVLAEPLICFKFNQYKVKGDDDNNQNNPSGKMIFQVSNVTENFEYTS